MLESWGSRGICTRCRSKSFLGNMGLREVFGGLLWICVFLVAAPQWFICARKVARMFIYEVSLKTLPQFVLLVTAERLDGQQLRPLVYNVYHVICIALVGH
jgi:hypothetical protein